jgi:hypothetical protein
MKELDDFVHTDIQTYVNSLNEKIKVRSFKKAYLQNKNSRDTLARRRSRIKQTLKETKDPQEAYKLRKDLYDNIKTARLIKHRLTGIKTEHPHRRNLKILYVRYADDWILLTNGNKQIAEVIKQKIKDFLQEQLDLSLSQDKTFVTDIRSTPAKFLGFELRHPKIGPLIKKELAKPTKYSKKNLQRKAGTIIWATIDKQRMINRYHMKGFCDKNGFPLELSWLSTMEPQVIIERYNAVIRGLAQFYYGYIRNYSDLQRWIYILRFSCFKTLAQKYSTNIKGVFKKFGIYKDSSSERTIRIKIRLKVKEDKYNKEITLLTYKGITEDLKNKNRYKILKNNFWEIEKGKNLGNYPSRIGRLPSITAEDYLEKISWVSLRTQASFAMPCANCGAVDNVQQHHVKHIRKTAYELISKDLPYKQVMALRNRKQVPLCAHCHKHLVHKGKYEGTALIKLVPTTLLDNRTLHVESFVKPGIEYHSKSLEITRGKRMD